MQNFENRRSGNEWLSAMLIPLYMRSPLDHVWLPLATKLAAGKSYLLVKFVARLFCKSMLGFLFSYFYAFLCPTQKHGWDNEFKHFLTNPNFLDYLYQLTTKNLYLATLFSPVIFYISSPKIAAIVYLHVV